MHLKDASPVLWTVTRIPLRSRWRLWLARRRGAAVFASPGVENELAYVQGLLRQIVDDTKWKGES